MMARREFLATQVGIQLDESVLPLANTAGLIAPWVLEARRVFRKDR
jgi:hypothetical protein